jgi:hypothetical protein
MKKKLLFLTTFLSISILSFGQTLDQSNTVLATQNRQQLLPPPVTATHLDFDGVNDFVEVGNIMPSTYTKEAWVYATSYSGSHNVISGGNTGQHAFWIPNGFLSAGHNGQWQNVSASTQLSLNTWYHIAVTYDAATTTMILYKDGVLISSNSAVLPFNGGNILRIGAYDFGGNLFRGSIDEVRIWNRVLPLAEIQNNMNCELVIPTTQTGLVAYYQFNQGFDAADNTSITSLTDASVNGNNGTLNNFMLTGTTSNWLAGSPIITVNNATVTTPVVYNQGDASTALTATTGANGTGLLWYTTVTGGTGSSIAPTPSTAAAGNTSYWVSSTNANGCESIRTEIVVTVNGNATHLNFDGANDYVSLSTTPSNIPNGNSNYTIEAMIKPSQLGIKGIVGWGDYGVANKTNALRLTPTGIVNYWWANDLTVNYTFNLNEWYHVVATYNGTTRSIYINGVLAGSDTPTVSSHNITNTSNVTIGRTWTGEYFNGSVDEVRIWNRALPLPEIQNNMNCELVTPTTQTGLVVYYQFNQGFDAVDNTSTTSLTDASVNGNNGTLNNFTLTSATSNWLAGSAITTGNTCTVFLSTSNFDISSNFKIYPNPTTNNVTIDLISIDNSSVEVYDINGRKLFTQKLYNNSNNVNIDNLAVGVYMFKVISAQGSATSKIIKQ